MRKISFALLIVFMTLSTRAFAQTADELNKLRIAEALEQAGEYEKALNFYLELYRIAPGNFIYFDGLRRTYMYLKKYPEAERVIEGRLKNDSNNVVLVCQLGDAYFKGGERDSGMIAWNRALAMSPTNPNTYRAVADVMVANRLFDEAIEVYRKGEGITDSKASFITQIARLYFLNMNYRESLHELLRLIRLQPKGSAVPYVQSQLGMYISSKTAVDQFTDEMEKEVKDNPGDADYRRLLGFLYIGQKNYSVAYGVYKWLDEHSGSDGTELMIFANAAFSGEAYSVAADAYHETFGRAKDKSVAGQALMGYAGSLRKLGEKDLTEDDRPCAANDTLSELRASLGAYERVLKDFSGTQYVIAAVLNSVEIKMEYFHDFGGAEKLMSEYRDLLSLLGNAGILTRIRLFVMEGKFDDALNTAMSVIKSPRKPDDNLYDHIEYEAAVLLYYLGNYDSSSYYLNKITSNPMSDAANDAIRLSNIISDNRGNPEALRAFANADAMEASNRIPEATAQLEDILKDYPQVPLADNARLALGSAYCKMGRVQEALKYYSAVAQDSTGIFADRAQFRICRIYQETLHQKERAINEYENFLVRFPNSIYQDKVRAILQDLLGNNS